MNAIAGLVLICILGLVGCKKHPGNFTIHDNVTVATEERFIQGLPIGAYDVRDIGNGWHTFECEINGKTKMFMFARYRTAHGYAVGTITEVSK